MPRALPLLACLALGGCLGGNRGLESVHQPVVENGRAYVPGCPDWSSQNVHSAARTDSNFGCASNTNLAAMIADPADLLAGRRNDGSGSSEIATRTIRSWRELKPTGAQQTITTDTKVGGR